MKTKTIVIRILPVACFLVLIIFLLRSLWLQPQHLPSALVGKQLPNFSLSTLDNNFLNSNTYNGQYRLLNIFASWCQACKNEHVFLLQLAHRGIIIQGVAYKDSPKAVSLWLQRYGNPYKIIGLDEAGQMAIDLGVYGTPETFLIDPTGKILFRQAGPLNKEIWKAEMEKYFL